MPPERIELRDLVLRRWSSADAAPLTTAVRESFDHLHPWMEWATERPSLADMQAFIDRSIGEWDADQEFAYAVFDASESTLLGAIGIHDRVGPGGWEIGYWVHADHTGRGIATTGAAVVTDVLMSLTGTERVEIHCDRNNKASAAVAARLGYRLDRVENGPRDAPRKSGNQMIWIMSRDAYPGSAAQRRALSGNRPPERIELPELVMRRWSENDADTLLTAIQESLDHLRPWMPWAAEPPTLSAEREFLAMVIGQWEADEAYTYAIFDPAERTFLGTAGLRRQPDGAWDIGYWVHVAHTGRGIATTGAAVLTGIAMSRADRVEIHTDQANEVSAKVPARLGYRFDRIEDDEELMLQSGKRVIWVLDRDAYPGSEAERRAR